ncbi:MAG: TAXI family TRAP transporter solute-binding subunit [Gemmatimonadota bacterium]
MGKRSTTAWGLLGLVLCSLVGVSGCSPGDRPEIMALATAGTGGVYYVLGGSIAELWSRELPGRSFVAEVTGGSVENLSLVLGDEVDVGFSMGTNALRAFRGTGSFDGREPGRVRALAALYPNVLHLVTLEGTGVESLDDLVGRRVSVGAPGSGTEVGARTLLEGNGISYDDFDPQRLNFNETANALRDGSIDAGFLSVGPPTSALMDLASARPVRFVPVTEEEVEATAALDPTVRRHVMAAGTYPGHEEDVQTVSTPNVLVVRAEMDEDLAYDLARVLFQGRPELEGVHPAARNITPEYTLDVSPLPLHPGTIRYLEESGHEIPESLIAPSGAEATASSRP